MTQENERDFSFVKNRILQYLEQKGISKYAFYRDTGTTNGILSQKNGISEENLLRFLAFYRDVNPAWLLRGEGEMLLEDAAAVSDPHAVTYPVAGEVFEGSVADVGAGDCALTASGLRSVPLYEWDTAAGLSGLLGGAGTRTTLCHLTLPGVPSCDGAVYVRVNSMYPLLRSGDIVLYKEVNPVPDAILWGEMYLLSFLADGAEYTTVRYLERTGDEACVRLVGTDVHHSPRDIRLSDICALALIKASVRFNTMG